LIQLLVFMVALGIDVRAHGGECLQWIKRTDVGSYGQRWQRAMARSSTFVEHQHSGPGMAPVGWT
jgi:hypothetical protein